MYYFFGFSYWKHDFIRPFFSQEEQEKIVFINPFLKKNYFKLALKKGLNKEATIYIWGKASFPLVEDYAKKYNLKIYRIEDGFIRSVDLGSDITQAYSLVIDSRGIYFDPTQESDLEHILQNHLFDEQLLQRASEVMRYLIEKKLSKYNLFQNVHLQIPNTKKVILVPGQVEDDASIYYGAQGMTNLELLQVTRKASPQGYIIYKPHPDVLVGNRVGDIQEDVALKYADKVVTTVGLESVLEVCDEVHTMTSLVGFEAILRGKKVFTYGTPFYAGWGLSIDRCNNPRRTRKLRVEELVAGVLLLYPHYIHPKTLQKCEIEDVLKALDSEKILYDSSVWYRVQKNIRNFISRKLQLLLRVITLKF
jgi:capsular polysaccharide export protein